MGRWDDGKAVWHIVKESAKGIGVAELAPHDCDGPVLGSATHREGSGAFNSFWGSFGADDRTLPWLQAAYSIGRQ